MKKYLESHMGFLKVIYYFLVIVLFFEVILYSYFHIVNDRSVKYLDGTIHYDKNSSINFDANEVVVDINVVVPKRIVVETNSSKPSKPNEKPKPVKETVYKFEYDKTYVKNCEQDESFTCASSKKILGYSGDSLFLAKVLKSNDSTVLLGLFEHNIYLLKNIYNDPTEGTCVDRSYGTYTIKDDVMYFNEKAFSICNACVSNTRTKDFQFSVNKNIIKDTKHNTDLVLLTKYTSDVINVAHDLGYFDGNILCKDIDWE